MIVYPISGHITDSPKIFFIGSAKEFCSINSQPVKLYASGNFAQVFDLKLGTNVFDSCVDHHSIQILVNRVEALDSAQEHCFRAEPDIEISSINRVVIDPGHGGTAIGTCSPKGIQEKDLNLQLSFLIRDALVVKGLETHLTREFDEDLALSDRVNIARSYKPDLFVSVHHNAIPDNLDPIQSRGISVHYYYEKNKEIASRLLNGLVAATGLSSAGLIKQNLHVLRENDFSLAVLIEFGYLIHPEESEIIISSDFQKRVSIAIAELLI